MNKLLSTLSALILGLALIGAPSGPARAQTTSAVVVSSCGSPPTTYSAGQNRQVTQDTNGLVCNSASPAPSPAAAAGIAPVASAALEACHVLKSGAGNLYSLSVTIQATTGIVQVFDAASAPVDGAVTPKWAMPILSNGTLGGAAWRWDIPLTFTTGITVCFSSATTPFTKTASTTAMISGAVK